MSRAGTDPQAATPGVTNGGAAGVTNGGATSGGVPGVADGPAAFDAHGDPTAELGGSAPVEDRRPPWRGWEPIVRVAGVLIAVVASVVSGVFELILSTLRAGDLVSVWSGDAIGSGGGPLIGLSIVLAGVFNYAIGWFAYTTTGKRWAIGPPWAIWTLLMLFAAGVRTYEGDYLLGGDNWVALVMILVGSLSYAVYSYRMILKRIPR